MASLAIIGWPGHSSVGHFLEAKANLNSNLNQMWASELLLLLNCFSHVWLCDSRDGSPPGSPVPGILQARTLEWVTISFSNAWKWKVKVKSLSLDRLLATPWIAAYQAPPSMGFSRQKYWSGVPLPSLCVLRRADKTIRKDSNFESIGSIRWKQISGGWFTVGT